MPAVIVRHQLFAADESPVAGRTVTAELVAPQPFLASNTGSVILAASARSSPTGLVELHLTPQSEIAASGTHYLIRVTGTEFVWPVVVPASGPVELANILVDPDTLDPVEAGTASLFLPRVERGVPNGIAPLGSDGKVPSAFLPAGSGGGAVDSVNGETGVVVLDAADVGAAPSLRQVATGSGLAGGGTLAADRTIVLSAGTLTSLGRADSAVQPGQLAAVATSGAYADLAGQVPTSALPALAVTEYLGAVANQTAMLALTGQTGDWCIRTDLGTVWFITAANPALLASWTALSYPAAPVASVNGQTGVVELAKGDVGLGAVANLAPADLPVSNDQQEALDGKLSLAVINAAGDLIVGAGDNTVTRLAKGSDNQLLGITGSAVTWVDPPAAGGGQLRVVQAYITSGNVNPLPDAGGVWRKPGDAAGLPLDYVWEIPAAVGDWVEIGFSGMKTDTSSAFLDAAVQVGTSLVRFLATGTSTPPVEGDPSWYPDSEAYVRQSGPRGFEVTADDLDSGIVRFVLANLTQGQGQIFASSAFPFYVCVKNLGPGQA